MKKTGDGDATGAPRAGPTPPKEDIDDLIAPLLAISANRMSRAASAFYRKHFGIGVVELRIVFALGRHGDLRAARIGDLTDLDKAAVSRSARILEGMGWIDIVKTRRSAPRLMMSLTDLGREKFGMLYTLAAAREKEVLSEFTAEEAEALKALLRKFIAVTGAQADRDVASDGAVDESQRLAKDGSRG